MPRKRKKQNVTKYVMTENILPIFNRVYTAKAIYKFLPGGRYSTKSKTIAQWCVGGMMRQISKGHTVNVVCLRDTKANAGDSCFGEIVWALKKFGVEKEFKITRSNLKITHRATGSQFHFLGLSEGEGVKSKQFGFITAVWYEEAALMPSWEIIIDSVDTFMRAEVDEDTPVRFYFSYNPDASSTHWLNVMHDKYKDGSNPDYIFQHSSYQDDVLGLIPKNVLKKIENDRIHNNQFYRFKYLGERVREFENMIKEPPANDSPLDPDSLIFMGIDSAYKGKDGIMITLSTLNDDGHVRCINTFEINKGIWRDGITGKEIVENIVLVIRQYNVIHVCVDKKEGTYIVEDLHREALVNGGFTVSGVDFHGGVNKKLEERKFSPSLRAANKRVEMHMFLQDLSYFNMLTCTTQVLDLVRDQIAIVEFLDHPTRSKKIMVKKEIYKKSLGKSPDELDSLILSLNAIFEHVVGATITSPSQLMMMMD